MHNKFPLIRLLFLMALSGSCKKQLNLLPTDSFPPAKAFANVADLQKGLEGVYQENTGSMNAVYIASILADEVKIGPNNTNQGLISFEWQYTPNDALAQTEYLSDFAAYYSMIDAINKELANFDAVTPKNAAEAGLKKRIGAELVALRGIAHFEVLIRFMSNGYDPNSLGVPIMLKSDLLAKPVRAKVGDVIAQVRADLAAGRAETNIPDTPDDVTRLNQAAIAAYQARVSLLTKSWDSVITFAGQALQLSHKALTGLNNFAAYWSDSNEVETLWKYRNQSTPQSYWYTTDGLVFFTPSDKLVNEFDSSGSDVRSAAYFKTRVTNNDTVLLINKYPGSPAGPQINDLKLVRVAELYLDLAEAYEQSNSPALAADNLNKLRENRIKNYTDIVFGSQQSAIQLILDERYKELCFEGYRFFDLKRNALPVSRLASDVQSTPAALTLLANDHHFALPIPQHELFANSNMVQNPGY